MSNEIASRDVIAGYDGLTAYYGDLHNHCGVSYGQGTLQEAFQNARLQLDFASVTVHAHWPDIPGDDPRLGYLVDYHEQGFAQALARWPEYQAATDAAQQPGAFVTLPSFEWHSMRYGDHVVYFKDTAASRIIPAATLPDLRAALRELAAQGIETLLIPHHIGYLQGYRGIDWRAFSEEFSPVVEIVSFHGLSEHSEAPFPYLHSMGPRDGRSTVQHGLAAGHVFGFIGSTDHHSAHPGHYGYGRLGVWADDLTRDALWTAINARRTYALSGDRIRLAVALNGQPMGAVLPFTPQRTLAVDVTGGDALDVVEVLHNNRVIHRWYPAESNSAGGAGRYKVFIELGWGEETASTAWTLDAQVRGGQLVDVEPRLRGHGIEPPPADIADRCAFSRVTRPAADRVSLTTMTWRNPTVSTPATQGLCLTIAGDNATTLVGEANGCAFAIPLGELRAGARVFNLRGFVSPAVCLHQAVPETAYSGRFSFQHDAPDPARDWYYARVRQRNGHGAWSSPIWVAGPDGSA